MNAEIPTSPVVFLKPATAVIHTGGTVVRPAISANLQQEAELVVAIGKEAKNVPAERALELVAGYGIGLDMTLRDVQAEAKKKGLPWTLAKGFDTSAALSDFIPPGEIPNFRDLTIRGSVNGILRQEANTCEMIFSVEDTISYLSTLFTLEAGDLLFMGTPEGVTTVESGDLIEAHLVGFTQVSVRVQ